jgi:hypothetical protein
MYPASPPEDPSRSAHPRARIKLQEPRPKLSQVFWRKHRNRPLKLFDFAHTKPPFRYSQVLHEFKPIVCTQAPSHLSSENLYDDMAFILAYAGMQFELEEEDDCS